MPKSVALNLNEEQLTTSKKFFVNDIGRFRKKALGMFSVKKANCLRALAQVLAS